MDAKPVQPVRPQSSAEIGGLSANQKAALWVCRAIALMALLFAIVWMALREWPLALGFSAIAAGLALALRVTGRNREPDEVANFTSSLGLLAFFISLAHLVGLL
jgi:hypothetical protein